MQENTNPHRKYIVGSGYAESTRYNVKEFAGLWLSQIRKYITPEKIFVVQHAPAQFPQLPVELIPCANLGHVHQLIGRQQPAKHQELCGWSAHVMLLALTAYNCECDLLFIEQDTLIFGNVAQQIHREIGDRKMLFGSCKLMDAAQSLFYVKYDFLLEFVHEYLGMWPDTYAGRRPEHKFIALEKFSESKVGRLSFGVDRDRPIPWNAPVWYCQHWTSAELAEAKKRGLI